MAKKNNKKIHTPTKEELKLLKTMRDKNLTVKDIKNLESRISGKGGEIQYKSSSEDKWQLIDFVIPEKELEGKDHIDILMWGDVHYGSRQCDFNFAKESLDHTSERGVYIIGMGDLLECATRDSVGSGVYDQSDIIQGQLETMVEWLTPHKDRVIGLLEGNHERRVYDKTGLDLNKLLCKDVGVNVTHGASGASLPYTKIKQCLSLQQYIDADLYAMGHVHALDTHSRAIHELDKRSKTMAEKEKIFVLTGHYLNYFGSYAHRKGLIPSKKGSPVIKLYTNEHKIRVSI